MCAGRKAGIHLLSVFYLYMLVEIPRNTPENSHLGGVLHGSASHIFFIVIFYPFVTEAYCIQVMHTSALILLVICKKG